MSIPEELERREERLKKLAEARTKIEARASSAWPVSRLQIPTKSPADSEMMSPGVPK